MQLAPEFCRSFWVKPHRVKSRRPDREGASMQRVRPRVSLAKLQNEAKNRRDRKSVTSCHDESGGKLGISAISQIILMMRAGTHASENLSWLCPGDPIEIIH